MPLKALVSNKTNDKILANLVPLMHGYMYMQYSSFELLFNFESSNQLKVVGKLQQNPSEGLKIYNSVVKKELTTTI